MPEFLRSQPALETERILSIADSSFAPELKLLMNERWSRESLFRFLLYANALAFATVFLAANGLGFNAVAWFVVSAYIVLALLCVTDLFVSRAKRPRILTWLSSQIPYDLLLAALLLTNTLAAEAAPNLLAVAAVIMVAFVTLIVLPKSVPALLVGKAILFSACVGHLFVSSRAAEYSTVSLFPLVVTFALMCLAGYWIHVTQLRQLQQKLEQQSLHTQLAREKEFRERLFVHIGHDLRQPINALGMLLHGLPNKDQNILDAEQCVRSSKRLIGDIVQIADYQGGELKRRDQRFALQSVLDEIAHEYTAEAQQAGCELRICDCSLTLNNDRRLISRAIKNFVSNAITHAPKSKILIGVRRRPHHVEILVIDSGPGIHDNDKVNIFAEFSQGTTAPHGSGFGLGLAIARELAKTCDADIVFDSHIGKGTTLGLKVARDTPAGGAVGFISDTL